jgi:hypothetical protein
MQSKHVLFGGIFLLLNLIFMNMNAQISGTRIGSFDRFSDIGAPEIPGTASYNEPSQTYLISGSGANNWFPHVSPDNKWLVFISFPKEVPADQHPFYQKVYLRMMPIAGGEAKVIGYLYGGQGTMNVPSWSPDSKKISFVSNGIFN